MLQIKPGDHPDKVTDLLGCAVAETWRIGATVSAGVDHDHVVVLGEHGAKLTPAPGVIADAVREHDRHAPTRPTPNHAQPQATNAYDLLHSAGRLTVNRFWDQRTALLAVADGPDAVLRQVNPAWTAMLGWEPDQLVGRPLAEVVRVEGPHSTAEVTAEVAATGVPAERLLGRTRTAAGLSRRGTLAIYRDDDALLITLTIDRGDSVDEVRALSDRLELAMTHAPIGMAISRLDGPWVAVNPALCTLFGRSEQELLAGLSFAELTHPEDLAREAPLLDELLAGERGSYSLDKRYLRPDGSEVWTTTAVTLVHDPDGTPRHYVAQCVDITVRRRMEAELRDTAKRLRASDNLRIAFLRATSHELRTPLTAVTGLADTLQRLHLRLPVEQVDHLLARVAANAKRLNRLIEDLLDVDRLSVGLIEPVREQVAVHRLVRTVLDTVELQGRTLRTDLEPVAANLDVAKVERIVANLVANAVRHTPTEGTIWVRTRSLDDGVELVVEDDGEGLPDDLEEAIFEPFMQGPGRFTDPQPGTGLGLTLVRDFAAIHGGSAQAANRPEGGARFTVLLR